MTTVISILNHKGGVLKTTVTANLGAGLARAGKKVLLVDLDAQCNLTQVLLGWIDYQEGVRTLYDALVEETGLDHLIQKSSTTGLDIIPCQEDFAGADISLVSAVGRESILKSCLSQTTRLQEYDIVLLDNPPSVSLVVMNSLVASDYFFVPCSAEFLPMTGLRLLGDSISKMSKVAPNLKPLGVVLTMFNNSERICRQIEAQLRKELGDQIFRAKIRTNTKAKSAPSLRKTIFEYEDSPQGRGTEDFASLTAEFLERLTLSEGLGRLPEAANG